MGRKLAHTASYACLPTEVAAAVQGRPTIVIGHQSALAAFGYFQQVTCAGH